METTTKPFNIREYVAIGLRRKWYIILPLVCSIVISFGVYKHLPKVYKVTTLILVQPQRVPEAYVRPAISVPVTDRLNTISQEILSRTSLEKVIREFGIYQEIINKYPMETIVEGMRKMIEVRVQGRSGTNTTFSVSFEGEDPQKVMRVTSTLASLFIEENLKTREMQAESISSFIIKELGMVEEQLKKKEENLRHFRERNMGQLPQQLEANLRIFEGLQQQLKRTSDGIKMTEDRGLSLQSQINQLEKKESPSMPLGARRETIPISEEIRNQETPEEPIITQWRLLKKDLDNARSKYTENHPDVINLKRKIANLDPEVKEIMEKKREIQEKQKAVAEGRQRNLRARQESLHTEQPPIVASDPATERLRAQYMEQYKATLLETKRLQDEERYLKDQIRIYQRRVEDTPKREQEFVLLTRDYDLLKTSYQTLLEKKMQAQMGENLERKQQGEQFKILDPARLPEKPIRPDRDKLLLMGTLIGLMSGIGLAWAREILDQSFHSEADLEAYLGLPILAVIPNLKEENKAIKA